jgi:hypothetical protein
LIKKSELSETIIEIAKSEANWKNNQTKTTKSRLLSAIVQPKGTNKTRVTKRRGILSAEMKSWQNNAWPRKRGENIQEQGLQPRHAPLKQWRPDKNGGKQPRTGDDSSAYRVTGRRIPPAASEPP